MPPAVAAVFDGQRQFAPPQCIKEVADFEFRCSNWNPFEEVRKTQKCRQFVRFLALRLASQASDVLESNDWLGRMLSLPKTQVGGEGIVFDARILSGNSHAASML